jgi:sugar-specific transcriptional regulator TrmB
MNYLEGRLKYTSEELKIYLTLLAFGSSSKNEISAWTTIPEEDIIQKL